MWLGVFSGWSTGFGVGGKEGNAEEKDDIRGLLFRSWVLEGPTGFPDGKRIGLFPAENLRSAMNLKSEVLWVDRCFSRRGVSWFRVVLILYERSGSIKFSVRPPRPKPASFKRLRWELDEGFLADSGSSLMLCAVGLFMPIPG